MAVSRLSVGKFLELAIAVVCLLLHYKTLGLEGKSILGGNDTTLQLLTAGTYVGFTIILVAVFAGYIMGTPINKRIDIFFSLIGCALYIACGILVFQDWKDGFHDKLDADAAKYAKSKAGLSIVQGVLFLIDVVFTFRE